MSEWGFAISYGKGEIESGIAPLVAAVRKAGFVTATEMPPMVSGDSFKLRLARIGNGAHCAKVAV